LLTNAAGKLLERLLFLFARFCWSVPVSGGTGRTQLYVPQKKRDRQRREADKS